MRVHELAKELGVTSKDLIGKLRDLGVEVKSHMSALDSTAIQRVREGCVPAPKIEEKEKAARELQPEQETPPAEQEKAAPAPAVQGRVIKVRGAVVVKDLAEMLGIKPNQLIAELMGMNILASITERVEVNVARKIAEKHGFELEYEKKAAEHKEILRRRTREEEEEKDSPEDLVPRPPVVTFLGHVDHGKTSLLDRIRNTAVTKGEFGGITQHIGAHTISVGGNGITFLDTPGHAAFTAMRARGANLTDIAVVVIAADDGVMPQTREAIMHAKDAGVALMVAINKMDLATANADRVRQQLQEDGLAPEDWGGDLICCQVSAQTGEGVEHLLEMILLQAEILELKANPTRRARGYVIEAQLEPGMGPTANLLVTNGALKVGDSILCSRCSGKVRALINDHGVKIKSALPATPVKCLGLPGVPDAGAEFKVCVNERTARTLAEEADAKLKNERISTPPKASLEALFSQLEENEKLELKIILKADTQGSIEAIVHGLNEINSEKVSLNVILQGTGNITVNDVMLASASKAVILGFHVANEPGVAATAKHEGVEIWFYQVIYELIDQVRQSMTGLLSPELKENIMGHAEVKQVFPVGKREKAAGCVVLDGRVRSSFRVRVKRADEILYEGGVVSLKHFQDDVAEVRESQECGVRLDNFSDFNEGDILELYETEEVEQVL